MIFDWAPAAGVIVDIVMLGFICTTVYLAYRKGLVDVIAKILAFVIAIILTAMLYKPVSNFMLEKTSLKATYSSSIQTVLSKTSWQQSAILRTDHRWRPSEAA